jgi:hypothetical protein
MPLAAPVMITRLLTNRTLSTLRREGQQLVELVDAL